MSQLMRCLFCGVLQDEPSGAKTCVRCGGELAYQAELPPAAQGSYIQVQMELDQVAAPAGQYFDRYLMVTLRTPAEVPAAQAAATQSGRPPLHFGAVLDISGSMQGEKLAQAKEAVRHALLRLRDGDGVSLVVFSDDVRSVFGPAVVGAATRRSLESALGEIQAGGMTALCGGLEAGIEKARGSGHETRLVLLLSDGQANVGETDLERIGQRSRKARTRGMIVSTLGVGMDYNEALMAEIATQGGGRFYHVARADQIGPYLNGELGEVAALAARGAMLDLDVPPGASVMPLSAAYAAQQHDGRVAITLGDIPSDLELEVPLRLTLPPQQPGSKVSVEGTLSYRSPAGNRLQTPLNRVTLRVVAPDVFLPREGVVTPVAERVLEQIRAASVLSYSRAAATPAARQQEEAGLATLREYAAKLGNERANAEMLMLTRDYAAMQAAPSAVSGIVAKAFATQRRSKKYDKS